MGRNDAESSRGGRSKSLSRAKTEATSENEDIQVTLDLRDKEQPARSEKEEVKGRLFIGGLSPRTTDDGLSNFLKLYGAITECFLVYSGGVSKCFGFATFEDPANAERLMRKSKELKLTLDGNTVRVSPASDRDHYSDHTDTDKKIFVGRLSWRTTEDGLLNYFRQYGTVVSSWILRDVESNKSRGFGFVVFEDKKDVDRVLAYEGHKLDGEKLRVKLAIPKRQIGRGRSDRGRRSRGREDSRRARSYSLQRRSRSRSSRKRSRSRSSRERSRSRSTRKRSRSRSPRQNSRSSLKRSRSRSHRKRSRSTHKRSRSRSPRQRFRTPERSGIYESNKLFVRGLGSLQDKRKLEEVFEEYGEVKNVFVVNGADKRSRGFGFVTFTSPSGVSRALSSRSITLDGKLLTVSRAKAKIETTISRSTRRHYSHSEPTKRRHRVDHRNGSKHSHDYREHRDHSEQLRHGTSRKTDERRGYGPDHHRRTESQSKSHELGKDSRRHARSSRHPQSSGGTRYRERATPEKRSTRSDRRREYDDIR